ncbi:acetyl-coenzyme-A carboxylase [Blastocladiella emersonii ATCC 22665]|nr:acetyl-coenzyme-A carboxylase [Blastocladiella emersonii ATCC 22665]
MEGPPSLGRADDAGFGDLVGGGGNGGVTATSSSATGAASIHSNQPFLSFVFTGTSQELLIAAQAYALRVYKGRTLALLHTFHLDHLKLQRLPVTHLAVLTGGSDAGGAAASDPSPPPVFSASLTKATLSDDLGYSYYHPGRSTNSAKGAQLVQLLAHALLITMQLPGFDERYRQFRDVTCKASPAAHEEAMNLINSPFSFFDVLPSLIYEHDVPVVNHLIALDMYVRRAYSTYGVHAVKRHFAFPAPLVEWHFQFPVHDLGIENASAAVLGMALMIKRGDLGPVRVGVMAAVRNAAELQQHLSAFLALFPQVKAKELGRTEPWHVLHVAVEVPAANPEDDEADGADADPALSSLFGSLLALSTATLRSCGIRRVTPVVYWKGQ